YLFGDSRVLPTGFTLWTGRCSYQFFSLMSPDPVAGYLLDCRQSGSGHSERSMDIVFQTFAAMGSRLCHDLADQSVSRGLYFIDTVVHLLSRWSSRGNCRCMLLSSVPPGRAQCLWGRTRLDEKPFGNSCRAIKSEPDIGTADHNPNKTLAR